MAYVLMNAKVAPQEAVGLNTGLRLWQASSAAAGAACLVCWSARCLGRRRLPGAVKLLSAVQRKRPTREQVEKLLSMIHCYEACFYLATRDQRHSRLAT